jgi:hypothetical protein
MDTWDRFYILEFNKEGLSVSKQHNSQDNIVFENRVNWAVNTTYKIIFKMKTKYTLLYLYYEPGKWEDQG